MDLWNSLQEPVKDIISPIAGGIREIHTFPESISSKVNVMAQQEFELANFEVAVIFDIKPLQSFLTLNHSLHINLLGTYPVSHINRQTPDD